MDEYSIDDNETTKQSERPTRPLYNTDHNNACGGGLLLWWWLVVNNTNNEYYTQYVHHTQINSLSGVNGRFCCRCCTELVGAVFGLAGFCFGCRRPFLVGVVILFIGPTIPHQAGLIITTAFLFLKMNTAGD